MWVVFLVEFIVAVTISILWANGISKMHEEHPDYKGEDFLNWDNKTPWDDDKVHTESDFR
jgi:hypothetical protein